MKTKHFLRCLFAGLLAVVALGAADTINSKKNYIHRLQPGDKVRIAVYQEEDLTTIARIDARGRITNLPLIGEITIGAMTIVEAQEAIQTAFREGRYLRNPQVTITVEDYALREVSIQGQVVNPGRYALPVESTYTVVELVTKAGGIKDIGKGNAVTITRIMPDGSRKVFTIDVESLIRGKKGKSEDDSFLLESGDIVYVPERLI
ncbi:MAG TPA: polysaccharide biosynthesis/export family protein [Candidatus Didemnitutus sp.]|nr:polysaccharide biosynthesis/export family protein [Candidatus Didemnitutus sp.]